VKISPDEKKSYMSLAKQMLLGSVRPPARFLFWLCAGACAAFPLSAEIGALVGASWEQHAKKESGSASLASLSAKGSASVHGVNSAQVRAPTART